MTAVVGRLGAALLQRKELVAQIDERRGLALAAQLELEQAAVEGQRLLDIADLERDMVETDGARLPCFRHGSLRQSDGHHVVMSSPPANRGRGLADATPNLAAMFPPERIVCLTEETVETLYLLGEQDRIVGISGYCVRPPEARRDKPRVAAFTSADIPKILGLRPDLVLAFSDLQADIVAALIRQGVNVHAFNQRTIAGIFDMIRLLGALVGAADRADRLARELEAGLAHARRRAMRLRRRPLVYFEEWDD